MTMTLSCARAVETAKLAGRMVRRTIERARSNSWKPISGKWSPELGTRNSELGTFTLRQLLWK
jgi:hypothetical protein